MTLEAPSTAATQNNDCATRKPTVMASITEQIGNTPLVRLNKVPQSLGIEAIVYAKLEFFNAGGSIKDRIALRMIEEAEREGRIKPGDTLIEPTSGNTYDNFAFDWIMMLYALTIWSGRILMVTCVWCCIVELGWRLLELLKVTFFNH